MGVATPNDKQHSTSIRLTVRDAVPDGTIVRVRDVEVGGKRIIVIAGPCAVENENQVVTTARVVKAAGAVLLRGGAYKPRSSPYTFQGLRKDGLAILGKAREVTGLGIVTELMDARHLEEVGEYADAFQIGSRNMQNFTLLDEVGGTDKPILLKRGMAATIKEFLFAAERIAARGNSQIILCERGIRTFETATRNTLDLNAVPLLKHETHLPVIVDPSHGTGRRWLVPHMARAAIAAGADGLIVEVHPNPNEALCDGDQSLRPDDFKQMMQDVRAIAKVVGRKM
jgi:3-deoxy-7-phosphoheptulonate synthase